MMLQRLGLTLLICQCWLMTACDGKTAPSDGEQPTLHLLIYSEYIDPDVLAAFEQRTGVRVIESAYESTEEAMAKLQHAGGDAQYDVVVVTNQAVPVLARPRCDSTPESREDHAPESSGGCFHAYRRRSRQSIQRGLSMGHRRFDVGSQKAPRSRAVVGAAI